MNIEPFRLSTLEALAKITGDRYIGSEITGLFRKDGTLQMYLTYDIIRI